MAPPPQTTMWRPRASGRGAPWHHTTRAAQPPCKLVAGAVRMSGSAPLGGATGIVQKYPGKTRCAMPHRRRCRQRHPSPRRHLPVAILLRPRRRQRPPPTAGRPRCRPRARSSRRAAVTGRKAAAAIGTGGRAPPPLPPPPPLSDRRPPRRALPCHGRRRRRRTSAAWPSSPPATASGVADGGRVAAARPDQQRSQRSP